MEAVLFAGTHPLTLVLACSTDLGSICFPDVMSANWANLSAFRKLFLLQFIDSFHQFLKTSIASIFALSVFQRPSLIRANGRIVFRRGRFVGVDTAAFFQTPRFVLQLSDSFS